MAAGSSFAAEDDAFDGYMKEKDMIGVYGELCIASDSGDNEKAAERKRDKLADLEDGMDNDVGHVGEDGGE